MLIFGVQRIPALSKAGMMQSMLFFVLTICDDHKRDYKGRWNQPYTFHEEAHKIWPSYWNKLLKVR